MEVILVGRPNSGKSTLFNRLADANQKVGNYAGCTVEKKTADSVVKSGVSFPVTDLPGLYSLKANTPDEAVALRHLDEVRNEALLVLVLDGNNLKEELILPLLLHARGFSLVVAVNMLDEVRANRRILDLAGMTELAGVPFFGISAKTGEGVENLKQFLALRKGMPHPGGVPPVSELLTAEVAEMHSKAKIAAERVFSANPAVTGRSAQALRNARLDKVLVHPILGPICFAALMFVLFQAVFTWAGPLTDGIETGLGYLKEWLASLSSHPLMSLVTDGILGGVGAVLVFVPPIALLFFLIGVFELSGYLPRAAYMVDRLMKPYGLEGKVFIPLLSSVACAVPGIMSTRTIENERTRILTIMISPLMTCSARLPVYTLLIATFIPNTTVMGLSLQGVAMFAMFALGALMALAAAFVLHRMNFYKRRATVDFLHLPSYRMPDWRMLFRYVWSRIWAFLRKAGTIIAAMAILIWFLLSYPKHHEATAGLAAPVEAAHALEYSYGGRLGKALEPAFAPIGLDWKLTVGVVASLAAREVFVSTIGTVFSLENPEDASEALSKVLQESKKPDGSPAYTLATCLSLLVFFAFSLQCISTIGVAARETNSWKIPAVMFAYMFAIAYLSAFAAYHLGLFLIA